MNINIEIVLKIKDIYQNKSKKIKYKRQTECDNCHGHGFEPNDNWSICMFCSGKGKTSTYTQCKYCNGTGKLYRNKCTNCNGNKVMMKEETITINNIFMVKDHKTVRYKGYGHKSKYFEQKYGELIVFLSVDDNIYYSRKEDDLYVEEKLNFGDLITGTDLLIDLPDDSSYIVKIPEKTSPEQIFKINDKGFLKKNKQRGNLLIKVIVMIDYKRVSQELIDFLNGENNRIKGNNKQ